MTRVGHVSCVWDHAHWIPGKILPQFDPSHLSIAHRKAKLEIVYKFRTGTGRQNDTIELTSLPRDLGKF